MENPTCQIPHFNKSGLEALNGDGVAIDEFSRAKSTDHDPRVTISNAIDRKQGTTPPIAAAVVVDELQKLPTRRHG